MEILISVGIITLCICNVVILGVVIYTAFRIWGNTPAKRNNDTSQTTPYHKDDYDYETAKREYQEQQDAFEKMMNFNAYKAYGMEPKE